MRHVIRGELTCVIGKGAAGHAAATSTGWEGHRVGAGSDDVGTHFVDVLAVAAHAGRGAVEERGRFQTGFGGLGPVPVWMRAGVAALIAKGLLILRWLLAYCVAPW